MSETTGTEPQTPRAEGQAAPGPGPDKPKPGKQKSWAFSAAAGLFAVGTLGFVMVACQAGQPVSEPGYQRFAKGAMAKLVVDPKAPDQPTTEFLDGDFQPVSLQKFRGKVLVVNLWATWCAPCITEMPTLGALQAAYAGKDLVVLPISVDRKDDLDDAKAELAQLGAGHLVFHSDHTYRIAYDLKAQGFPTTIVYAKDGREIGRVAGEADWNSPDARALIDAALAE